MTKNIFPIILFCFLYFIILSPFEVFTQNQKKIDSLNNILKTTSHDTTEVKTLASLCQSYKDNNPELALQYGQQGLVLAQKISFKNGIAQCFANIGMCYEALGNFDKALGYALEALNINKETGNKKGMASCFGNIGNVYYLRGNYDKAIENFLKSLKIAEELMRLNPEFVEGEKAIASNYSNIGIIYKEQNNFTKALEYHHLALKIRIETGNKKGIAISYSNIGVIYAETDSLEKALDYNFKAIKIREELGDKKGLASNYTNSGQILEKQKSYDNALRYYFKALKICEEINDKSYMSGVLPNISSVYLKLKNYNEALSFAKNGLSIAKEISSLENIRFAYKQFYEIYDNLGDFKMAYNYHKLFTETKDSIYNAEKHNQIAKMEAVYQTDKKQKEIELLNKDKKLQNVEMKNQKLQKYFFFAGFTLMFVLAFVIFRSYRQKHRSNILLAEQKKQIEEKNEELNLQNIEIAAQRDLLEQVNIELEKLSLVARETDNAVLIANVSGEIEWVNEGFSRIFGFSLEDFKKERSNNLIDESSNPLIKELIKKSILQRKSVFYESEFITKDNRKLWLQTTLTPILTKEGNVVKLVTIDSDITKIKFAEEKIKMQKAEIEIQRDLTIQQKNELEKTLIELQKTQKQLVETEKMALLGGLVAGVAHEINTPVGIGVTASSAIVIKTKEIISAFKENKMKRQDLEHYFDIVSASGELILNNLERTGELVQSFKQVSVDQVTEQQREFNFKSYIEDVFRSLTPKLKETPVPVTVQLDIADDIIINSFPGPYAQIITNLVVNSIIHGFKNKETGIISLFALKNKNNLIFEYRDNGKGMSTDIILKIFDPFFTTDKQRGTGLGMHIVYNLITQKLKGKIICESEEGKGVLFKIETPLEI